MARTLTAGVALNLVAMKFPRILTDGFGARYADEVQSYMWDRYPWRGSLVELPPFHLLQEEADYGPPLYSVPADFAGLHDAWLRESTGYQTWPLVVKKDLKLSFSPGTPTAISYQSEKSSFRLHPRPSHMAPEWWVEGIYKTNPAKITNDNLNSLILPWEDKYFLVFRKGLEWKMKEGTQDEMTALALFDRLIDRMAASEDLMTGVTIVTPFDSLSLGGL